MYFWQVILPTCKALYENQPLDLVETNQCVQTNTASIIFYGLKSYAN